MPCRLVASVNDHVTAEPPETLLPAVDVVEGIIAMKSYVDFQWVCTTLTLTPIQDKYDLKAVKMALFWYFLLFTQNMDRKNRLNEVLLKRFTVYVFKWYT